MKPLSQMTREELWALPRYRLLELVEKHGIKGKQIGDGFFNNVGLYLDTEIADALDTLRLELQQSAAEARRESLEDR